MKRPGKRLLRCVAAVILAPPLLWAAVVYLMPTGWIRDRVVAKLKDSTGHEVRLGALELRPFGGVVLTSLDFASPKSLNDPWLKVSKLDVDVSFGNLVHGRIEPTVCQASGVTVRIRRDAAGLLEIDELFHRDRNPERESKIPHEITDSDDPEIALTLLDAVVIVIDVPTDTELELTEVHGRGSYSKTSTAIDELTGRLNGGTFDLAARLDKAMEQTLAAHFRTQDVNLGVGMKSLAYMIPLLASRDAEAHARGVLALDLELKGRGESNETLGKSLKGHGRLNLDGLNLDNSRIMTEIHDFLPLPTAGKLGSLSGTFQIADRRVSTADTVLRVADIPVNLSGWSDFDGKLDYLVKCEKLTKAVNKIANRLPPEARELLADLPIEDLGSISDVKITGTIDKPKVKSAQSKLLTKIALPKEGAATEDEAAPKGPSKKRSDKEKFLEAARVLTKKTASKDPNKKLSDKEKAKEIGRRLLERSLR